MRQDVDKQGVLLAEILLFHHVLGLSDGVRAFADDLRAAGHTVHTPDLFGGHTNPDVPSGVEYAESIGFDTVIARGVAAAETAPGATVFAGFSMGCMPAEELAMTRPGVQAAILMSGMAPLQFFGDGSWPAGVPLQVHVMEDDPDGDVDDVKELAASVAEAEAFFYPGDQHLFAERGNPSYDEAAATLVTRRVLDLLAAL